MASVDATIKGSLNVMEFAPFGVPVPMDIVEDDLDPTSMFDDDIDVEDDDDGIGDINIFLVPFQSTIFNHIAMQETGAKTSHHQERGSGRLPNKNATMRTTEARRNMLVLTV